MKTNNSKKYNSSNVAQSNVDCYAPEYTKKEKLVLLAKYLTIAAGSIALIEWYLLPSFSSYIDNISCYDYKWLTGFEVVFYGLFAGFPLGLAIMLFCFEGFRNLKVLQLNQNPLPNEKVWKPTKYSYGFRAKIKPIGFFAMLILLVLLSIIGAYKAHSLLDNSSFKKDATCLNN
ncbi:hypothetical protein ACS8E3_03345 [Psychrobacter sp. 2Y5]|uniref:hypothetical protein n=1 Tax=unclassified Psychrobacter TaxID=196806 RepID=UPI003F454FFB